MLKSQHVSQEESMSVKIGVAPGQWSWTDGDRTFFRFAQECEELGWDSIWLTDRLVSEKPILEPVAAMAAIAATTKTLKFGSSVLIPSLRNPVVLAKQLATVDFLSGGRLLPAIGLGSEDLREYESAGIRKKDRAARTDEGIRVMRRLWTENNVTHHGHFYKMTNITIEPKPLFQPFLPIWIGGRTEYAQRRVARLGDGWIASTVTPKEIANGIKNIGLYLEEEGRSIEEDHYGVILGTYAAKSHEDAIDMIYTYTNRVREDIPLANYTLAGTPEQILEMIEEYRLAGISKFILRLACRETESLDQLAWLAETIAKPINLAN
jgi:probable F420-dependent oxidoreductase